MAIKLSKEAKQELFPSIRRFFKEKWEQDVGDLKAELLLDFCLREICPAVYNQAIRDAQSFFQEKVSDLEGTCYEPEMMYWRASPKASADAPADAPADAQSNTQSDKQ